MSAFHKKPEYIDEREVRFIYFNPDLDWHESISKKKEYWPDFNSKVGKSGFCNLKLEYTVDEELQKELPIAATLFPYVKIKSIITGSFMNKTMNFDFMEIANSYIKGYENKPQIRKSALFS